jgi:hypothetical protein
MDVAWLTLVLISCIMFALLVSTFARTVSRPNPEIRRVVESPHGEEWLSLDEVAQLLGLPPDEVLTLVANDSIPFFVLPRAQRNDPRAYWFSREEIDAWVIG